MKKLTAAVEQVNAKFIGIDLYKYLMVYSASSMLGRRPFALPHDRQPRAVDDQVDAFLGFHESKVHVQDIASP